MTTDPSPTAPLPDPPTPAAPSPDPSPTSAEPRPGPGNAITDVAGIRVGQVQRIEPGWATGTTVILADTEHGAVASVDVRGGAPGTRETDALHPGNLVQHAQAVCLSGGSAYGLAAADGVLRWLGEHDRGFPVGALPHEVVPIVPAAVLFDLPHSAWGNRPDADFGYRACAAAAASPAGAPVEQGNVGAGAGATVGGLKGGVGTASVELPGGVTVGALVVVNAQGSAVDPVDGVPWAAPFELAGEYALTLPRRGPLPARAPARPERATSTDSATGSVSTPAAGAPDRWNSTLAVIATDAALTKTECHRVATVGHDGMARALRPVHTMFDGDTVFALSTEARVLPNEAPNWRSAGRAAAVDRVGSAGADVLTRAIGHALLAARTLGAVPAYPDVWPAASPPGV